MTSQPTCASPAVFFCILLFSLLFLLSNVFSFSIAQHARKPGTDSSSTATHERGGGQGKAQTPAKTTDTPHSVSPEPAGTDLLRRRKGQDLSTSVAQSSLPASPDTHLTAGPQQLRFSVLLIHPFFTGPQVSLGHFQL